ncbi:MAG: hypothetical protein QM731_05910 [Chitinophagaceae bacterium]
MRKFLPTPAKAKGAVFLAHPPPYFGAFFQTTLLFFTGYFTGSPALSFV